MQHALKLAAGGLFTTAANPRVGCIIVKNGVIVGQAYHQRVGEKHAEALALIEAGDKAKGATAYVTLEPCSHTGKNPPCAEALIQAGVAKVVVCNDDPNPLVAGGGYAKLSQAGIEVIRGVKAKQGQALNQGFLHRMQTGLPWVRSKSAQSLDGRTALASGESYWITGEKARADVQYWRGRSGAIITGIETVIQDDCQLNFRPDALRKKHRKLAANIEVNQPLRVVVDSGLRTPLDAKILNNPKQVLIATASHNHGKIAYYEQQGIKVKTLSNSAGRVDLIALIQYLGELEINEVLIESGATLSGAFLQEQLIDEIIVYTAPVLMGSNGRSLFNLDIQTMDKKLTLDVVSKKMYGDDIRILARPIYKV